MSCFRCFSSNGKKSSKKVNNSRGEQLQVPPCKEPRAPSQPDNIKSKTSETTNKKSTANKSDNRNIAAQTFTFRDLASATKNFRQECLLGEGGFGRVYKGRLENNDQVVAVKQLDRNGLQGNREFLVEVLMLSLLHHQNLVNLIGYCADGDQRLLVYEYMPLGSVEDHLLGTAPFPISFVFGYIIYKRLLTWSKLFSQFCIVISACSIIAFQAQPMFKDQKRFPEIADPLLQEDFPVRGLNQAVAIAAMCLQEEATVRPLISDVVTALSFLSVVPDEATSAPIPVPSPLDEDKISSDDEDHRDEDSTEERQRAVAEAIEWGSNSRANNRRSLGESGSSF
ncbi:hypothetical protein HHK36_013033 [Tetracentron sinense]|uniref:Protein kinase domain-containing protein n=1 Tax=Tetracentron sinense TaxID=13715 RepID=A0A834ZDY1_TETSI|nr:hypothetical protein HHK36_013033 [Tetracentron sinense]